MGLHMRTSPLPDPDWIDLRKIEYAVGEYLNPEASVFIGCYFRSDTPDGPLLGYVDLTTPDGDDVRTITHTPGIPIESLYNTEEMAEWIVNQIRPIHPDWFL